MYHHSLADLKVISKIWMLAEHLVEIREYYCSSFTRISNFDKFVYINIRVHHLHHGLQLVDINDAVLVLVHRLELSMQLEYSLIVSADVVLQQCFLQLLLRQKVV